MGLIGDDDRREKSQQHREAAFSRHRSTPINWTRRAGEKTVDGIDTALTSVYCALPFTGDKKRRRR